ncbi:Crp/Fnr family transcriptional regulator [Bacillus sp. Marseille-Q3570]|uniref:Crp/Fnr family transcriptional regulator n=1 Tax=Bacillus sp. Marseille-Q3570 TaxID=2963522 RepID=UPI0021B71E61|nr:cyclic nucleotide-binding domain-containing protein [Bacillus sp. Marseille-Q3570]
MKEIHNRKEFEQYIQFYNLESIFNPQLIPHMSFYRFKQGELIASQGDTSQYLYVLVKGKVKIFTTTAEGKALILSFKTPLELIGDIEYVQGIDFINTVEAVSDVDMLGIHQQWLKKFGREDASFLNFLLEIITQKFCVKSNSLSFNLLYPVEVRLASYLLSISDDESDIQLNGQLSALSLKDTANLIGTSYRHLNRVIQSFDEKGLVERKKGYLLVKDREGLREIAGHNIYE